MNWFTPEPVPKNEHAGTTEPVGAEHPRRYSLIESAKICGVEPRAYLGEATRRAIRNLGTMTLQRDLKSPRS